MNVKSKITVPNCITSLRIIGALCMIFTPIFTMPFYVVYTFCGITDVLDGFIARMTKQTTEFGAKLDSVSDLLFYAVMLHKIFPHLINATEVMPVMMISLISVRILSYTIAAIKYHKFASLHTYMNKLTGFCAFTLPYFLNERIDTYIGNDIVCYIVYGVAMLAAIEEIFIHAFAPDYKTKNRTAIKAVKNEKNN